MKLFKIIAMSVPFFLFFDLAAAQTLTEKPTGASPGDAIGSSRVDSKFSVFDPSRFSMQQSYTVSYLSSGDHGQTIGLYLNSMQYELSNSLRMNLALGWVHNPSQLFARDSRGVNDYGSVLPNIRLQYRPSENFLLQFSYETIPGVYSAYHRGLGWPYGGRSIF